MTLNNKLKAVLQRVAAADPLQETNQDVLELLNKYEADAQEVVDFLEAMTSYPEGEERAELYLAHVRASYEDLWQELTIDLENAETDPPAKVSAETDTKTTNNKEHTEQPAVVSVVDPNEVTAETLLDMVLFNADSENPVWNVFANSKPLAAIHFKDQRNADTAEMKDLFTSDQYRDIVIEGCNSPIGAKETLQELNAQWYASVVEQSDLAEHATATATAQLEENFAERLANLKESLLNHANLAITASMKGMFVDNPLRSQLIQSFQKANVANGGEVVNEIFESSGQEFFAGIITQAEKWMGYSPEAMSDLTQEILAAKTVHPLTEQQEIDNLQQETRKASTNKIVNVPIVTRNSSTTDYREDTKQRLGSLLSRRNARGVVPILKK